MTVLPVLEATVNLSVAMSKSPSIPVSPVTSKVVSNVTALSTFKVPFTVVVAPLDAILTAPPLVANDVAPVES